MTANDAIAMDTRNKRQVARDTRRNEAIAQKKLTSKGATIVAVIIAIYTALLGIAIPSGGGKWLVEAPYVMQSATDVGMNLGWTVQIYNISEALPNLVNPFFMLPLLAVLKLRPETSSASRSCSSSSICRSCCCSSGCWG